jgi:RNA polymerase sigma factor (sigma-70 family)
VSTEEDRFAALMREHGPGLGRVVASYARPADQDDLAQEVAMAIWNALPSFRGGCSLRTFVYRIAHNRSLTHLARRRAQGEELTEVADRAPSPESSAAGRQDVERLFAAIRSLTVPQRQVLTLALEDLTHAEIAACLDISLSNVAVRLNRARAALRQHMEESS